MKGRRIRIIPTLLIDEDGRLVKTLRFGKRTYIGDPLNAARVFNEKEVDELIVLDIDATRKRRGPDFSKIEDLASEAFMPLSYGGGLSNMDQVARVFESGVEKVVLSSALAENMELVSKAAAQFGSQAIAVCLPVGRNMLGKEVVRINSGQNALKGTPNEIARKAVEAGAGEIIVYDMKRDGTFEGYDTNMLRLITQSVRVPVVACGGASKLDDFIEAINEGGASAVAAGSFFVYQSGNRGILITYPSKEDLETRVFSRLV
ncbi:MAG TPA: AglZ/HisF2 family acetamidino modification protein [Hyphomonas sp.]|nr:AglZ/HisF2 family acetamidino modification protein [Hyphomonas sp.]